MSPRIDRLLKTFHDKPFADSWYGPQAYMQRFGDVLVRSPHTIIALVGEQQNPCMGELAGRRFALAHHLF